MPQERIFDDFEFLVRCRGTKMAWVAPECSASGAATPPRPAECVWASARMAVLRATDHPDCDPGKFIADENAAKVPRGGKELTLQPQQCEFLVVSRAMPHHAVGIPAPASSLRSSSSEAAAGLVPEELRSALVEVYDWWDPHLKQLTFHAGEAWGREERRGTGSDTTSRLARKPRAHPRLELRL